MEIPQPALVVVVPVSDHLCGEFFFSLSNGNFPCCNLFVFPLVLALCTSHPSVGDCSHMHPEVVLEAGTNHANILGQRANYFMTSL